ADIELTAEIQAIHKASRGTYGAPRVHAELVATGQRVGRKRVARLMHRTGIAGVSRRQFTTTVRDPNARPAPDLVDRNFTVDAPDRLWVHRTSRTPTSGSRWFGDRRTSSPWFAMSWSPTTVHPGALSVSAGPGRRTSNSEELLWTSKSGRSRTTERMRSLLK